MSDSDKMRAEFEQWAEDNDCGITLAATSATGFYTRNIAWTAWQSAYQAGRKAEREDIWIEWEGAEALTNEVERLRADLAAAKAASVLPVEIQSVYVNKYLGSVVVFIGNEKGAVEFDAWLRDRMKDTTPPAT